jgi:phosphoglycerate dehydrogenase-like enzyme
MQTPPVVMFLDHDHILRLVEIGMTGANASAEAYARALFAPDPIDIPGLRAMAAGATDSAGVIIRHAVPSSLDSVAGSTILITRRGSVSADMITACPDLKLIQRLGERRDGIDIVAAKAQGVAVSCLPRPTLAYTAEHAILLMLALSKKLIISDRLVRQGGWDASQLQPADNVAYNWAGVPDVGGLFGRNLGIIGLGEVGMLLARRAAAFGMHISYTNRRRLPESREREAAVSYASLDQLLTHSDHVVLAAANVPENERLIGAAAFARMKRTAFFVNISRGRMVDEDALYAALSKKLIAGAGLDVHQSEPRAPRDRFASLDNVIVTPHTAGGSRRFVLDEVARIYDNCRAALAGSPPPHGRV